LCEWPLCVDHVDVALLERVATPRFREAGLLREERRACLVLEGIVMGAARLRRDREQVVRERRTLRGREEVVRESELLRPSAVVGEILGTSHLGVREA